MNLHHAEGIVFRSIKYGESSIICDIYTREKGLKSYIVSGIRGSKSKSSAYLYNPCCIINIIAYNAEDSKLSRIKEAQWNFHFKKLQQHVMHSSIGLFFIEISRNCIKEKEQNIRLYDFIKNWLLYLDNLSSIHPYIPLLFMKELSYELGIGPLVHDVDSYQNFDMLEGCFVNATTQNIHILDHQVTENLKVILRCNRNNLPEDIRIDKVNRYDLLFNIIKYFQLHISDMQTPKSVEVLRSIF